jgi:hypothetical protein
MDCACPGCGVRGDPDALSIDHVGGGGVAHDKELQSQGKRFGYRWLKSQGYPPGYRVLCLSCNMALGFYGYCPHEREL